MLLTEDPAVDLATPSGPMRTYLYRPLPPKDVRIADIKRPGLVVYSEIFQRTAPIDRMARLLAGHGFVVAVPEIFHELEAPGAVLAYDQAGADRGNAHKLAKPVAAYDADARAVLDWLAASPACNGKLGALGICIGGHLAFRAALQPDVRAAACFYATDLHKRSLGPAGDPDSDSLARAGDIRGELMMMWGRQDPHIPDEGRALIQRRLVEAGCAFTWHEHHGQHAFLRDEGPRYDPELALSSYQAVVALFRRALA
ncbi:MAG: dienelactone hydrolase family protein [Deltaproteobacteria bacterium]|nr:dienelactone hydrolase family protein [Deltaproteobacteria bacterium]